MGSALAGLRGVGRHGAAALVEPTGLARWSSSRIAMKAARPVSTSLRIGHRDRPVRPAGQQRSGVRAGPDGNTRTLDGPAFQSPAAGTPQHQYRHHRQVRIGG
jgi:hypothetical protein